MIEINNKILVSGKVAVIEVYHKRSKMYFYVTVDSNDLDKITKTVDKLYISIAYHTNYCLCRVKGKTFSFHRFIMGTPSNLVVDHINHNGLDNRKSNLRNTTYKVNRHNRKVGNKNPLYWSNNHLLKEQRHKGKLT